MNAQAILNPVAAAVAEATNAATVAEPLNPEQRDAITAAAVTLGKADRSFDKAIAGVADSVARVLGTEPTYDLWMAVAGRFQIDYIAERECDPATAQKRWFAVTAVLATMELHKPIKPTKAAEVKAEQRKGAAAEAQALIERAKATTPAAVLALSTNPKEPVKPAVVKALAAVAADMATKGAAAANEAAREESKKLRDDIRAGLRTLNVQGLRQVLALVVKLNPKVPAQSEPTEQIDGAAEGSPARDEDAANAEAEHAAQVQG